MKDRADFLAREQQMKFLEPGPKIYDRVPYISDPVYAFINARDPICTPDDLNRFLREVKPIFIYCRLATSAEMVEHILTTKKEHKPFEWIEKVSRCHPALVASYEKSIHDLVVRHHGFVLHYNWKVNQVESLTTIIRDLLKEQP